MCISGNRLSFKEPRDLTLGAAPTKSPAAKKVFVPNLNVTRIKKENTADNNTSSLKHHDNKKRGGKKDKFEKKERQKLIQTTGSVFSEGIGSGGAGARQRSGFSVKYESDGGAVNGGGLSNKSLAVSYDKDEEERRLKALMRDDCFVRVDRFVRADHFVRIDHLKSLFESTTLFEFELKFEFELNAFFALYQSSLTKL